MLLKDLVNGLTCVVEEHNWFVENISYRDPSNPVSIISMKRGQERVLVRVNSKMIAASATVGLQRLMAFRTKLEDKESLDRFREFIKTDFQSVHDDIAEAFNDLGMISLVGLGDQWTINTANDKIFTIGPQSTGGSGYVPQPSGGYIQQPTINPGWTTTQPMINPGWTAGAPTP